jgi:hypothetical protein
VDDEALLFGVLRETFSTRPVLFRAKAFGSIIPEST